MSASDEIVSLAFIEPFAGREQQCEAVLKAIGTLIESKQYGRDELYLDGQNPGAFVLARHWRTAETRRHASEDPEMHRLWREVSEVCRVTKVYEELRPVRS
jgi:hypothetical protein